MPAAVLRTYVVSLRRRPDRRLWFSGRLPRGLSVTFTSDWDGLFDGQQITREALEQAGVGLFPWPVPSDNPWWNRPLKTGEIGCTLAHLACWRHAHATGAEPYVLVLEDDAVLPPDFLDELAAALELLAAPHSFDLLYLGRFPLESSRRVLPGIVSPGYSHCTFAYLLTRGAIPALLDSRLEQAVIPIDEFLPAMYLDHPRVDVRARFSRRLRAVALEPPLVHQRPKEEAGSDTELSRSVTW
ncbi:glycosyltransferase family 25 protein [Pseudofrankia sp. BMG5.37]|uniref:glycosyltransferase family 25 protein n=1 Tax=Pseudofrankia sp. BMG5.37 TaxID=3050035 RepID=UPI002894FBBF|nr:glycosyltransferase family 25 protein [Pseudofrankia sp. BMG5.37]MDT3444477.1 glycosyltransferase family 25 protein [Pseudofrankia sp. BMG5.37]